MDNPAFVNHDETAPTPPPPPSEAGSPVFMKSTPSSRFDVDKDSALGSPSWYSSTVDLTPLGRRRMSRDAVPCIDHYRLAIRKSASRPTLEELHEDHEVTANYKAMVLQNMSEPGSSNGEEHEAPKVKFGWIEGVLIRNMLSIWGVMLFLRISWVVAQSGIWQTLIIIAISTFITLVTALSMSAIATNGEIGGGGTYYVMSRILGPEFGGSIGIIFAIANAINCSLNVVGFCQTVQSAMWEYGGYIIVDGGINDTRILGVILMILVWSLCGAGAKYEAKTQSFLLVILLVALTNFLVGSIIGPRDDEIKRARGFLGYDLDLFAENWNDGYIDMQSFFSVFSVYFPAGIGILSGANVSGDLRDPSGAIPIGTILAIIITSISYAIVAIICAGTTERSATGCPPNDTACVPKNETYGSYYDYQLMTLISAYGPLNYAGIFAATLSSSLASYVSCPKLLQVIGDDGLYPYWLVGFMAKGYGKDREPHLAYLFTFIIALIFVLIASLDTVALLISNFFLATFALMNYSTFHVSLVKPIGWRPTFKYYNMWLSLFVALLCIVAMFLVSWEVALATIGIVLFFYLVVVYRNPEVNWGSSTQALTYNGALNSIHELAATEDHVKNYRPQVLVLTGPPSTRPALVDFANLICKNHSLLICGNVVMGQQTSKARSQILERSYKYLRMRKMKGFCTLIDNMELSAGVSAMLSVAGVGKMKPNILLLGYKNDWRTCDKHALDQYFASIHAGFHAVVGVVILRHPEGLDFSGILGDVDIFDDPDRSIINGHPGGLIHSNSSASMAPSSPMTPIPTIDFNLQHPASDEGSSNAEGTKRPFHILSKKKSQKTPVLRDPSGKELPKSIVNKVMIFSRKHKETIDVWWLYDDGGLTMLLPHIINTRSNWSSCKLRVICTASGQLNNDLQGMKALLEKFRIEYSDLVVIEDPSIQLPSSHTVAWFDSLVKPFIQRQAELGQYDLENELRNLHEKTNRHLRLRELLIDHSSDSSLIFMTLPMPRKGSVSAPLYMAWLEALTANMPPFVLVRGNQTSVLTFYS